MMDRGDYIALIIGIVFATVAGLIVLLALS